MFFHQKFKRNHTHKSHFLNINMCSIGCGTEFIEWTYSLECGLHSINSIQYMHSKHNNCICIEKCVLCVRVNIVYCVSNCIFFFGYIVHINNKYLIENHPESLFTKVMTIRSTSMDSDNVCWRKPSKNFKLSSRHVNHLFRCGGVFTILCKQSSHPNICITNNNAKNTPLSPLLVDYYFLSLIRVVWCWTHIVLLLVNKCYVM